MERQDLAVQAGMLLSRLVWVRKMENHIATYDQHWLFRDHQPLTDLGDEGPAQLLSPLRELKFSLTREILETGVVVISNREEARVFVKLMRENSYLLGLVSTSDPALLAYVRSLVREEEDFPAGEAQLSPEERVQIVTLADGVLSPYLPRHTMRPLIGDAQPTVSSPTMALPAGEDDAEAACELLDSLSEANQTEEYARIELERGAGDEQGLIGLTNNHIAAANAVARVEEQLLRHPNVMIKSFKQIEDVFSLTLKYPSWDPSLVVPVDSPQRQDLLAYARTKQLVVLPN